MLTGIGAMKSFTAAVNESDARLFRCAAPKALQLPDGMIPESVRLTAASPKVLALRVLGSSGGIGSTTSPEGGLLVGSLIEPSKFPVSDCTFPQQGTELFASHTVAGFPLVTHRW